MKIKLIAAVVATTLIVGFTTMNAAARGWGNGRYHMMSQEMVCGAGLSDADRQKFLNETKEVRGLIAADRAELHAIMAGQNPDSKRARELAENIAANKFTLQEKSQAYGGNRGIGRGGCGYCMW